MLELVVEADPVHPFEGLVEVAIPLDGTAAAHADERDIARLTHRRNSARSQGRSLGQRSGMTPDAAQSSRVARSPSVTLRTSLRCFLDFIRAGSLWERGRYVLRASFSRISPAMKAAM
jgi:hypothetical protein